MPGAALPAVLLLTARVLDLAERVAAGDEDAAAEAARLVRLLAPETRKEGPPERSLSPSLGASILRR